MSRNVGKQTTNLYHVAFQKCKKKLELHRDGVLLAGKIAAFVMAVKID
jgi:hypothetical protein